VSALVHTEAIPGLSASLSMFNLLDGAYGYIGPYATANESIPGPSREFVLKFLYRF
jgi:hypothetical protein